MRSISFPRLGFWLFSALSVVVLAMAFEITKSSGESWIQGFGTIRYDTLCSESPSKTSDTTTISLSTAETGGIMSESWCSLCKVKPTAPPPHRPPRRRLTPRETIDFLSIFI